MVTDNDKKFLEQAIQIALDNIDNGGGPFGAVVVRNGEVISASGNRVVEDSDPTAHAEVLAIRKASGIIGTHSLEDCTIYTSCEPCPMCLGAIYWSGIKRVVYSASRYDVARAGFSDEDIYNELSKEPSGRSVEFVSAETGKGLMVFEKWAGYPGKVSY
ncbi:MAG: nucleoside deaminase [Bacteroidales bacterium]|nr:nucleoside deaminase [Bacteroidales bacterium]